MKRSYVYACCKKKGRIVESQEQQNGFTTIFKKVAGILLIVFGIIGLFLPFLQGVAMIIAGVVLLGNKTLITKIKHIFGR